jgi:hypothetical protein
MISRAKARKRPSWMQRYQRAAVKLGADSGRLDWNNAEYHFRCTELTPEQAAEKCAKRLEKPEGTR